MCGVLLLPYMIGQLHIDLGHFKRTKSTKFKVAYFVHHQIFITFHILNANGTVHTGEDLILKKW